MSAMADGSLHIFLFSSEECDELSTFSYKLIESYGREGSRWGSDLTQLP